MLFNSKSSKHDLDNATISHREELAAIAAYERRIRETDDPELKKIMAHNLGEERMHAASLKAWLARANK